MNRLCLSGTLFLLACFLCSLDTYGQRRGARNHTQERDREDSTEGFSVRYDTAQTITDTLPLPANIAYPGFHDLRLVRFYYDSISSLERVVFRNGTNGYYIFYFKNDTLKKARVYLKDFPAGKKYYYTATDNEVNAQDSEKILHHHPGKTEFLEVLKLGRSFLDHYRKLKGKAPG